MDVIRMRMSEYNMGDLIRPPMLEIKAVAAAYSVHLSDKDIEFLIRCDPIDMPFNPSMCQDIEKATLSS